MLSGPSRRSDRSRSRERERERERERRILKNLRLIFLTLFLNSSFEILILLSLYLELCHFSIKDVKVYLCAHATPPLLQTLLFFIKLVVTRLFYFKGDGLSTNISVFNAWSQNEPDRIKYRVKHLLNESRSIIKSKFLSLINNKLEKSCCAFFMFV